MRLPRQILQLSWLVGSERRHFPSSWFSERLALFFGAVFLIYGVHITYFPVWLHWRGLGPEAIGVITALPIFARTLLTPWIAAAADTHNAHRAMIIALSMVCAVLAVVVGAFSSFWPLLLIGVPFAVALSTILPLTETIAVWGVREAGHDYGRMRLWGSLMFLVATVATGVVVDSAGAGWIAAVMAATSIATVGVALLLPSPPTRPLANAKEDLGAPEEALIKTLLAQPVFIAFLITVGSVLAAHATWYTFGALHLAKAGLSGQAFGALWGISIAAEIALLAYSAPLVAFFGPVALMTAGAAASVGRWVIMSFDPPFWALVGLQGLHALTYGATHVGAIHFIARAVPTRGAGTAQALYSAVATGLFTGCATIAAGQLYPSLAGKTFLVMAGLAACGLIAAIMIGRTWTGGALLADAEPVARFITPTAPVMPG